MISEVARRRPDPRVLAWLRNVPDSALHMSVLTLGELRHGVESVDGARKEKLRLWLEQDVPAWFEDRLLPVTVAVADRWGRLLAEAGRPVAAVDSLLAATALVHGLRLVTRNTKDFEYPELELVNPWQP